MLGRCPDDVNRAAIHDGMFRQHGGETFVDQIKWAHEQGFRSIEDNGMMARTPEQQKQIVADTMVGGATLTKLIGTSAWYAPGAAGAALVETIVRDEKKLFTCSVSLNGEYGQKDICLGVPVVIGKSGWEKIVDFDLNEEEKTLFSKSADAVRSMNDVLKTL